MKNLTSIYNVIWFNEDYYGITKSLEVIVQAVNSEEVLKIASIFVRDKYNLTEDELNGFEKVKVKDISYEQIIYHNLSYI
ncbi:MAG: hypothetical protein WC119_02795 [Synergistaceae bacterium]